MRGGYIAASSHVNIPYEYAWTDPEAAKKLAEKTVKEDRDGTALKDAAGIRELVQGLGTPRKRWWLTGQTGTRSTETSRRVAELGYSKGPVTTTIRGSSGARTAHPPAKNVSYFDFVKVNAAMKKLEALEKRVAALEPKKQRDRFTHHYRAALSRPFFLPQRVCSPRPRSAASAAS